MQSNDGVVEQRNDDGDDGGEGSSSPLSAATAISSTARSNDDINNNSEPATTTATATAAPAQIRIKEEIMSDDREPDAAAVVDDNDKANELLPNGATTTMHSSSSSSSSFTVESSSSNSNYNAANGLPFEMLCRCFEKLWNKKKTTAKRWNNEQKLIFLLPPKLLKRLDGGDPYPLLRLVMPQIDTARPNTGMQESNIYRAWSDALGLSRTSRDYLKLKNYTDPNANPTAAGDLSETVRQVVQDRYVAPSQRPPKTTVGQINDLLDELVVIKTGGGNATTRGGVGVGPRNHEWRTTTTASSDRSRSDNHGQQPQRSSINTATTTTKKQPTTAEKRVGWVTKLLNIPLSPLEHKWIVRILLQKVELGISHRTILGYISPYADDLYNANNSLKRVCSTLSDKEWIQQRKAQQQQEDRERQQDTWQHYMPRSSVVASLGNTISPMLANRTTFEAAMTDIESRHKKFAKELLSSDGGRGDDNPLVKSLALKFPTFCCEVKLDGERMLLHVQRGVVTVQTRNSKWYSNLYSPTLGPPIRRAIQRYDVDVILDGEVISWDNGRQEIIPFGVNRTVANDRRAWCAKRGLLEDRDMNHHQDDSDLNVMNTGTWDKKRSSSSKGGGSPTDAEPGAECWLQFIVFDVLYVGGPDASRLISEATSLTGNDISTGSILNLSGFDRKKILYRLIEPQVNQVEFVPSLVVRRDGQSENAAVYFSPTAPPVESDTDVPCSTVDSVAQIVNGNVPNYEKLDAKARGSKTDEAISALRAGAMNKFYIDIVEKQGKEGLVFKDLLAPYCVGDQSRLLRYWNKMKPDYASQGHSASDIDAVILGAYYATGMAKSGQLNAFLLGCVDEKNPGHFMTLCKVNGGSVGWQKLKNIFEHTGFRKEDNGSVSYGKWFQESNHGKSVPDFISHRSFQDGNETLNGWTPQAKKYPDLWIDPEDSVVLTLNSGEITTSDEFSAGVSLRFPRIEKVRLETADGDVKPAIEAETCGKLHQLYREMDDRRKEGNLDFEWGSSTAGPSRFLSAEENAKRKKSKPRKDTQAQQVSQMPKVEKKDSAALSGVTLVVLEGNYSLDEDSLDAMEAKEEGWFDDAKKVKSRMDVLEFIARHSGTSKVAISSDTDVILGGRASDARVAMYSRMLDSGSDPGKKDTALVRLRQLGGIAKWSYVYSSVRRWIDEASQVKIEEESQGTNHRSTRGPPTIANTQLPRPTRHDYLFIGKSAQLDDEGEVFGIQAWKDINIFDLKRGLEEVQRSKRRNKDARSEDPKRLRGQSTYAKVGGDELVPWQHAAITSLPACDRWILAGDLEKLWMFRKHSNVAQSEPRPTVVYPDLFDDCGMHDSNDVLDEVESMVPSTRWADLRPEIQVSALASALPLARTMGAQVTPHLHDGVTHVLCLLRDRDHVDWDPHDFRPELFEDRDRAVKLHHRLWVFTTKANLLLSNL